MEGTVETGVDHFLRWMGGAVAATFVSHVPQPFVVAAVMCLVAAGLLTTIRTDAREVPAERSSSANSWWVNKW